MLKLPYFKQKTDAWCGPASIQMVLAGLGTNIPQRTLARWAKTSERHGTGRRGMREAVRRSGHRAHVRRCVSLTDVTRLLRDNVPVIVNYLQKGEGHFSVIVGVTDSSIIFNGPYYGRGYRESRRTFLSGWNKRDRWTLTIGR